MRGTAILLFALLLPSCALFDNSDPREGAESVEACLARTASLKRDEVFDTIDEGDLWVPTFTYDVTKADFDTIKELSVTGADETAGTRLNLATNESSTARARFLAEPVDEKGAFFLAHDPALYRVRGEPLLLDEIIPAGCERQQDGMRLTKVEFARLEQTVEPTAEETTDTTSDNENDS